MTKYSIISVVNNQYKKFAIVFLKSALANLNMDNIHEIHLLDTGLTNEDHDLLSNMHEKINLTRYSDEMLNSKQAWDDGWQKNVDLKTTFAKQYLQSTNAPTCMVDIDCMFINDISHIMSSNGDVVLCDRSDIWSGMPIIASFVAFINVDQSIKFLNDWRTCMLNVKGFQTKETPALNDMVRNNTDYDLLAYSHKVVGLYNYDALNDDTCILHFKGGGSSENCSIEDAVDIRFKRFSSFSNTIKGYLQDV